MSVRVMTAVWSIDLPDSEKIVLLALADCANDEGGCWPSMATLTRKCSKTDRTIQAAIKSLVAAGHLTRVENPGKGCFYTVHPTPEAASPPKPVRPVTIAPPKRTTPTPEADSGKPSKNHQISSVAKATSVAREDFPRPAFASPQLWSDFLRNRHTKKLPNTKSAHKGFLEDIDRLATPEWPPPRLFEYAVQRGWGAIYAPREGYGNGSGSANGMGGARPNSANQGRTVSAALDFIADGIHH